LPVFRKILYENARVRHCRAKKNYCTGYLLAAETGNIELILTIKVCIFISEGFLEAAKRGGTIIFCNFFKGLNFALHS
jgi:hypothetical protein